MASWLPLAKQTNLNDSHVPCHSKASEKTMNETLQRVLLHEGCCAAAYRDPFKTYIQDDLDIVDCI